jgi:hypothetical protein
MECQITLVLPFRNYRYSGLKVFNIQSEIKKFGFKASKSKPAMISLLEECWQASQQPPPTLPSTIQDPNTPVSIIAPDISSPALLLRIHTRISQLLKSDVDQSVYSGILRYEPVVVEDLVEWLAEREIEVPELVVRGWCDKEGVCCVGRENLRGGRRARY